MQKLPLVWDLLDQVLAVSTHCCRSPTLSATIAEMQDVQMCLGDALLEGCGRTCSLQRIQIAAWRLFWMCWLFPEIMP